jgi:hypothetical protein
MAASIVSGLFSCSAWEANPSPSAAIETLFGLADGWGFVHGLFLQHALVAISG